LHRPDTALSFYKNLVEHFGSTQYAGAVRNRLQLAEGSPDSLSTPVQRPKKPDERRHEEKDVEKKAPRDKKEIIE
jgi:hypothetical protein